MGSKICKWCKEEKPIEEFCKDKSRPRGFSTECRKCANARNRVYYANNKEKLKETYRMKTYGIAPQVYEFAFEEQQGRCAICLEQSKLCIDHEHKTGRFRGLLCDNCNRGLGMFRDNFIIAENAATYLRTV